MVFLPINIACVQAVSLEGTYKHYFASVLASLNLEF
jgi:hypothetical protein